jgi:hypothetical protein
LDRVTRIQIGNPPRTIGSMLKPDPKGDRETISLIS